MTKRTIFIRTIKALILLISLFVIYPVQTHAAIGGSCSNCHTMHNSQNGAPEATFGIAPWQKTTVNEYLTKGDCMGCHGMGTTNNIEIIGTSEVPQVFHNDGVDLAGGNFAYITGFKGGGASDAKGHNVKDLANIDNLLDWAPGVYPEFHDGTLVTEDLSCAGTIGCHGNRGKPGVAGMGAGVTVMAGAHHQNETGQLNTATEIYNSYRFLRGVKGYENDGQVTASTKWQNSDSLNHNEYFGAATPADVGCSGATSFHSALGVVTVNNTISGFCATCHGSFHVLDDTKASVPDAGIGGSTSSPFTRHPTDILLPGTGEYTGYTIYSVEAPVARSSVPAAMSAAVGATDVVMCLSCHMAHASNYPDMLRWDYSTMIAGGGSNTTGCFTCHTEKDQ